MQTYMQTNMQANMQTRIATLALAAVLTGCAAVPPEPAAPPPQRSPEDVKLTLNLPDESVNCLCQSATDNDRTFLERGMETLADGDYIEAVQYFQRYQRLEQMPLAQWEGDLAIAYVSMLPSSPFYDVGAALLAYTDLQSQEPEGHKHHSIVLMQQALESFVLMQRHIWDLESRSDMLQEDLDKREQALKRLRELTLGKPED
ncbi:MAG: hypothetical protein NWP69_00605 [Congregibacter sp.]|nr:hypothetical protein [Congregibacter sp.]